MFCSRPPFVHSGCPQVFVDLSFPNFSYCSSPNFIAANIPKLQVPVNRPSPDIGDINIACFDIRVSGFVTFATPRLRAAELYSNATFMVASCTRATGVSSASFDNELCGCENGRYKLRLALEVPCLIDGIPDSIPVKVLDVKVGDIFFKKGTLCSIVGVSGNIGQPESNAQALEVGIDACIFSDDITGEIVDSDSARLRFEKNGCLITKLVLEVPPICNLEDWIRTSTSADIYNIDNGGLEQAIKPRIDIWGYDRVNDDDPWHGREVYARLDHIPVIEITSPDFKIYRDGLAYKISSYRSEYRGPRGSDGLQGPPGDVVFFITGIEGYTGRRGYRGTQGSQGMPGIDAADYCPCPCNCAGGHTGPRGPQRECPQGSCNCTGFIDYGKFTGIYSVIDCNIINNAIHVEYVKAEYHIFQDTDGIKASVTPSDHVIDIMIQGQEFHDYCDNI